MRALALGCLLAALVLGCADLRSRTRRAGAGHAPAVLARIAGRYDRSRAGRRLGVRLWNAQIHMSPAAWRAAQLMLAAPVATVAVASGATPPAGLAVAITVTRSGGGLLLRVRRGAATTAVNDAAPRLARALATELAAWGSGGQALTGAARRCEARDVVAGRVLQAAAARVLLGGDASAALRRALDDASPALQPSAPAARLAAVFSLHRHDAAATAAALERLAAALEDEAAAHKEATAASSDVRMSALAVPVIAGCTLAMLLATDPAALAAALSMPLLPMLGVAILVVMAASLGVRRFLAS
jgi:Type II secretion system (T2SS), protein F